MEKIVKGKSMWVVKIGGSLLGSPELARWLELFVKFSDGKVIIVPGGGLFADAVREAQSQSNAHDSVAHKLAVLAMDQFGLLLAGLNPGLATASSELEIAERTWQHRGIVWLPSKMVLADDTIPQNWQVTSDSLSAWLANKIGAEQLILVKSRQLPAVVPNKTMPLQTLVKDGLIDSQFIDFATGQNYKIWALNKADCQLFEQGLSLKNLEEKGLHINITLH
ncbi:MAG TPA: uridylate kinase [Methylotenera sp.]|nr:uridylate kinase [Methylotenera sp.]